MTHMMEAEMDTTERSPWRYLYTLTTRLFSPKAAKARKTRTNKKSTKKPRSNHDVPAEEFSDMSHDLSADMSSVYHSFVSTFHQRNSHLRNFLENEDIYRNLSDTSIISQHDLDYRNPLLPMCKDLAKFDEELDGVCREDGLESQPAAERCQTNCYPKGEESGEKTYTPPKHVNSDVKSTDDNNENAATMALKSAISQKVASMLDLTEPTFKVTPLSKPRSAVKVTSSAKSGLCSDCSHNSLFNRQPNCTCDTPASKVKQSSPHQTLPRGQNNDRTARKSDKIPRCNQRPECVGEEAPLNLNQPPNVDNKMTEADDLSTRPAIPSGKHKTLYSLPLKNPRNRSNDQKFVNSSSKKRQLVKKLKLVKRQLHNIGYNNSQLKTLALL